MSIAGIPVGWLVCSINRSAPAGWCLGWLHHDPSKGLVALCQAQKGCNERQTCSGQWNMVRPLLAEFTPEKQNSWALLNVSLPLICHFEYQQTLGSELALYEVVEGSKTEKVSRRCRCRISPRAALTALVCWHVMSPTKLCVLSVELVRSKRTWFILFHKKLLLIPIRKKSTFVFLPCFNFKNNACLYQSTLLPRMVLIFIYESHILLQTYADKVAGQSFLIIFLLVC